MLEIVMREATEKAKTRAKTIFRVILLLSLAAVSVASAQEEKIPAKLKQTLKEVGRAITSENVSAIRPFFSDKKILVRCPFLSDTPDYYGAAQVEVMLERFFKSNQTLDFHFLLEKSAVYPGGSSQIPAKWDFQEQDGGKRQCAMVYVTFESVKEGYAITSLRASP
jgi:hypothetical protein